jgi:peptidoglycan/LPS O-acetylase OafA/YrhL
MRRILRIFPLYYLILVFGFVFYKLIAPHFGYFESTNYDLLSGIILGATFFANILATMKPGGILEILWSIGIEEQFYIFIAPILKFMKIKNFVMFLFLFTSLYFIIFHVSEFNFLSKYSMFFYFFSFSGLIAYLSLQKIIIIKSYICYPIYSLFLLLFFSDIIKNNCTTTLYHLICMITFSVTIWLFSLKSIPFLNTNFLTHLGKISYGIYMYHAIVFQLVGFIFIKFNIPNLISNTNSILLFYGAVIMITIIISHFSYKYFESYFIKLKKH